MPTASRVLAALDVGTNSFHLVIARVQPDGSFEVITRDKDMVRLGEGGGDMTRLSGAAMDRAVRALTRMARLADSHGAELRAVATSAVREAENAHEFLARARSEAGIDVEVISGVEEARLIHLGVLQALDVFDRRLLLVDIGGGSTEVVVGHRGRELVARSFKLGAVRLTERFFPGGGQHPAAVSACRSTVRSSLAVIEREVLHDGFEVAIASSGTAEAVARMVQARRGDERPRTFNGFRWSVEELDEVVGQVVGARGAEARRRIPGLDTGRADIIVAGALLLQGVAHTFGVNEFTFSDFALREGVLLDTMQRLVGSDASPLRDVARRSVRQLAERCDDDPVHSGHVAQLATHLFDQTMRLHQLDVHWRHLLEAAALLANVGLVVSHSRHHLHSYYVIRNSELVGFTDHEIELIALIARYHRKGAPKPTHPEFARLSATDQRAVRVVAGLLRVAIGLDRRHDQRVRSVTARRSRGSLEVKVHGDAPGQTDLELEIYAAQDRSELLGAELGLPIRVKAERSPTG
jgi:exopolyphosphatase / guanosine-5'-triphosphate,3'-diphosphate pyrophosphatase